MKKILLILFSLIFSVQVNAQVDSVRKANCDCDGAIILSDTFFTAINSPEGFGKYFEYPIATDISDNNDYEGEHNSAWFKFSVPFTCQLGIDIMPVSLADDYDFIIYKYSGNERSFCLNLRSRIIKPERMIISEEDTTIKSMTGLKYNKKKKEIPPGPGESYGSLLQVKKGEVYYLMIDNVHEGKGFALYLHYNGEKENLNISFRPIYFKSNEVEILSSSIPTLDSVYYSLLKNPKIKIDLEGHVNWPVSFRQKADSIGLQELSEERAKAVYSYLMQKGISSERISYKGFGNSRMICPNAKTEEEQERNRRVEILVKSY